MNMHKKSHSLKGEHHIQQFHNNEHFPEHHDASRTMWWEMGPSEKQQGYASGGSVIASMRKRGKKAGFGSHPLHGLPGIHIVTAEAGEPVFTGEK
jgi:hypothetical protein